MIFDKYEIVRRLALGGMGEVFLARQTGVAGFDRLVILKSLLPELAEQEGFIDQFLDEARVAATLNHPNIVAIYEVGLWNGIYFIAMEYIHGEDLSRLIRAAKREARAFPIPVAARVIHDAACGLHHAHTAADLDGNALHIVHRDISPQNIMVRSDGVTKVVDFGIAKAANRSTRTATGLLKGKLQYMPPEQINHVDLDGRSDQWSLGVVLWELVCGQRLFKGSNDIETLRRVLSEPIPPPREVIPGLSTELDAIIMRMLERDPTKRYPSCEHVATELKLFLDSHSQASSIDQVAHFVTESTGNLLEERKRNLTPMTQSNFLFQLSGATGAAEPSVAPEASAPETVPGSPWGKAIAVGALAAMVLAGVGYWGMASMDDGPTLPPAALLNVPLPPAKGPPVDAGAEAVEPPKRTLARLRSEPSGASVWVGGRLVGETPIELDMLAPDVEQEVSLIKRGFRDEVVQLTLTAGQTVERDVRLRPAPRVARPKPSPPQKVEPKPVVKPSAVVAKEPGFLTLQTTPWVKVEIDGMPHGSTPLWKQKLDVGSHTLRLTNEQAGIDVTQTIRIGPGAHEKRRLKLN